MPVRLVKPYNGQAVNTMYFGGDEEQLLATNNADAYIEQASDYQPQGRIVTGATANVTRSAQNYIMNSASAQTITLPITGYYANNTKLTFIQQGAGAFTIVGATGVTISTALASLKSLGVNSVATLTKTAPLTWVATGGLGG